MYRQYRKIESGERILVAIDSASGGGDDTAGQLLSATKLDVPLVYQSEETTSSFVPELARLLPLIYQITGKKPLVAFERQNGGSFLIDRLAQLNYAGKWEIFKMPQYGKEDAGESVRLGWDTNSATRPKMLQELKDAQDHKAFKIYDLPTLRQMLSFITVKTAASVKAQAERGSHDDLVMALAIVWQLYILDVTLSADEPEEEDYTQYESYQQPKSDYEI